MRRQESLETNIGVGTAVTGKIVDRTLEDPEENKAEQWFDMLMNDEELAEGRGWIQVTRRLRGIREELRFIYLAQSMLLVTYCNDTWHCTIS